MRNLVLAVAGVMGLMGPARADDAPIALPSGLSVTPLDVITDEPGLGLAYRFRFVSPELTMDRDYVTTEGDMVHLCRIYALPVVTGVTPAPTMIVISLADRPLEFGAAVPDAVQFFETYAPRDGDCIWQAF